MLHFPNPFLTIRYGAHFTLFSQRLILGYQFWRVRIKNIQFDYPQDLLIFFRLISVGAAFSKTSLHFLSYDRNLAIRSAS